MFRERTRAHSPVPELTRALVRELRAERYRLAVVSSSGRIEVEPLLRGAAVLDLLDVVVCGEDVRALKPSPEPYLEAGRRLGVTRALVVEDSDAGCASGEAAGFDVLRVASVSETPRLVRDRLGRGNAR
jgi:HAD superfamily hydrolase (TIGR01509 family)